MDTKDIMASVETVRNLLSEGSSCYVNIDAAHGISTAMSYVGANDRDFTPICIDLQNSSVRNLKNLETIAEISHITLSDYLGAIGAKQLEDSHELPKEDEYDQIIRTAEVLFEDVYVWNKLCSYIGKHYSRDHYRVRIPADLDGDVSRREAVIVKRQLEAFVDNGFLKRVYTKTKNTDQEDERDAASNISKPTDTYQFVSERKRNYLVVFGIWLEMYIYIKLMPYFDEVHCGFVIDWDNLDAYDTKDNEIDVVAMKNSRPVLISCKMRMPTKEDIYEIGYISEMVGGALAVPVVATTAVVDRRQTYKPGLYPRFKKMNVGLIETQRIKEKSIENILQSIGL